MFLETFIRPLYLLLIIGYFFIAAQGAFYLLAFGKALRQLPADNFITLRRTVDPAIRLPLKVLYLGMLAVFITWLVCSISIAGLVHNIAAILALLLYIIDIVLVLKVSEPVNKRISSGGEIAGNDAATLQQQWINAIMLRGCLSVAGFLVLVIFY